MAKRQKNRQYNGQKTEGQTIQWPKDRRTDNTMAKRQKDRHLLSFGHCIVCPSVFWPLYCLSFCLLAIVLSVLLSFGLCIVCPSVLWPLYCLSCLLAIEQKTKAKRQKDRKYNGQTKIYKALHRNLKTEQN
jgi:hypothetical protein